MTGTEVRTRDETEIRRLVEDRVAALRDRDADALAATYATGAVKFDLAPPLQDTGPQAADPAYWRPWLGSWAGPITLDVTELDITIGADIAFGHGLSRMRGTKIGGGPQDLWYRAAFGLGKTGGAGGITHEHNSTPFYMDGSGRAANDLWPETGNG